jgi:hypothetical protein
VIIRSEKAGLSFRKLRENKEKEIKASLSDKRGGKTGSAGEYSWINFDAHNDNSAEITKIFLSKTGHMRCKKLPCCQPNLRISRRLSNQFRNSSQLSGHAEIGASSYVVGGGRMSRPKKVRPITSGEVLEFIESAS